jgi:predicted nucleic acid-binding protein
MSNKVLILIDADVLIHLFKADRISLLNELFPKRLRMLDIVLNELRNNQTMRNHIDGVFRFSGIVEIPLPTTSQPELFREYLRLKTSITGDGERATLVYCKYHQHIIASSNTKDIIPFSQKHSIAYLTTLDIFAIAIHKGLITNSEVNDCILKITKNGSYLRSSTIENYLVKDFDPIKYSY